MMKNRCGMVAVWRRTLSCGGGPDARERGPRPGCDDFLNTPGAHGAGCALAAEAAAPNPSNPPRRSGPRIRAAFVGERPLGSFAERRFGRAESGPDDCLKAAEALTAKVLICTDNCGRSTSPLARATPKSAFVPDRRLGSADGEAGESSGGAGEAAGHRSSPARHA